MSDLCSLGRREGYEVCIDEVRVERRGKSSPITWEHRDAVNSIRSNTVVETLVGPTVSGRWLEHIGNGMSR